MLTAGVFIPSYNYERFLPISMSSVLTQHGVNVRMLVIDNCSEDNSLEVAREVAGADSRVEVRAHDKNVGQIGSLNEGVRWAMSTGSDFSVALSADDALTEGSLSRAASIFERYPEVGLVYGRAAVIHGESALTPVSHRPLAPAPYSGLSWAGRVCRSGHNPAYGPEVAVRSSIYAETESFNNTLPHTPDLEMWLRCAARSDIALVRAAPQAYYRMHPGQLSHAPWANRLSNLEGRREAFDSFFERDHLLLPEGHDLDRLAHKALAHDALRLASDAFNRGKTESVDVEALENFARRLDPDVMRSWDVVRLRVRQQLGPRASRGLRAFEFRNIMAKLREGGRNRP